MLTSLDLYFMIKELSILESSKLSQVYHPSKKELLLQFHTKNGKVILNIQEDKIFLTENKERQETASNLAMFLRKKIGNSVLTKIEQKDFERILILSLKKEEKFQLIIELFSKGNVILINDNNKILSCTDNQRWKDRDIRPGLLYKFPPSQNNLIGLNESEFETIIKDSKRSSIVKTLAVELNLGGSYAEELCFLAKIDKNKKELEKKEISTLYKEIENLKEKKLKPNLSEGEIFPIELKTKKIKESFKTFSEALATVKKTDLNYEKALEELKGRLKDQKKHLKELEVKSINHKKIGDLLYQEYNKIENIFKQINETKWQFNSKEILEKNPQEKKIIIELK